MVKMMTGHPMSLMTAEMTITPLLRMHLMTMGVSAEGAWPFLGWGGGPREVVLQTMSLLTLLCANSDIIMK